MITSETIKRRLWDGANELRGSMDAGRYKDYMLGLMFYKFLSDKTLETFRTTAGLENLNEYELVEEYKKTRLEIGEDLDKMLQKLLGYYVAPDSLYQTWVQDINKGDFEVSRVRDCLSNFERTISAYDESGDFKDLFSSSTLDLSDTALGSNLNERSKNIKALILLFADLNMVSLQKDDVLGDAYEYLIGQFAMESGKKAGEFYTPRQVSEVMAQIVAKTSNIKTIYDPTVGSGSLLLTVRKHLKPDDQKNLSYYGQEKNTATYNLTRMNLLLHGVRPEKMSVKNGDTLSSDWPEDPERPNEGVQFDAVVMNPPYSVKNWNKSNLKVSDPRFEIAGVLPPDSKGDFAFLLHGLFHLGTNGTMAIVLPHGVLFRGGSEGEIRKRLLEKNYIDTIVGLPNNLFTNTGIPVTVLILKKNRKLNDPVMIIDASNSFIKVGKQNVLLEKDIAKIVDTYVERTEEIGYSHLATREVILENEYNLNIPRYVISNDTEIPHDVDAHLMGGIPKENIDELKILNNLVPEVLENSLKEIRPNYVELTKEMNILRNEVLNDSKVISINEEIKEKINNYIKRYWEDLKHISSTTNLNQLKETMLNEIKTLLSEYKYVDVYEGYEIIAQLWINALNNDTELIAANDFYTVSKMREKNMVTKGTGDKKREEQDGWVGSIIPLDLVAKHLYQDVLKEIENDKAQVIEMEAKLTEIIELTKEEDTNENLILIDTLKRTKEDEPGDSFDNKLLKEELKKYNKNTEEYTLVKKIETIIANISTINKDVKTKEKDLTDALQERILVLTNEEIDIIVQDKWFGNITNSIISISQNPINQELSTLEMLNERYKDTLTSIDNEIETLMQEFELLKSQLVLV